MFHIREPDGKISTAERAISQSDLMIEGSGLLKNLGKNKRCENI